MMKYNYKLMIIIFALLTSCTFKTNITGYIKLQPHYKLSNIHLTKEKPAILDLNSINEWDSLEEQYFDYTTTKIHSTDDPFLLNFSIQTEEYTKNFECEYHLVVDRVGQSGSGTITINNDKYNFYLVDKWSLLIDVNSLFKSHFSEDITLEFIMWGS